MLYNKDGKPYDFTDFLMDDEFVGAVASRKSAGMYISELKAKHPDLTEEIDLAIKIYYGTLNLSAPEKSEGKKETWDQITEGVNRNHRMIFLRMAAAIGIMAGLSAAIFFGFVRNDSSRIEKYAASRSEESNDPRLILTDGNTYIISEEESEIKYSENGVDVIINDSVLISQHAKSEDFNEIIIPFGKISSLTLSDGTRVWINAGSRLVFPPLFAGKTREVFVEGEAYFEVVNDGKRPFVVKTSRFEVEVKGTKFSVQADKSDSLYTALLIEGKVTVKTDRRGRMSEGGLDLAPGLIARVADDGSGFNVARVEHPENFIAWKNGYLVFMDEPFNELIERVARYYNIEIVIRNLSMDFRISGKLDLKEDPERVLKGLSVMAKCNIMKEEDKYVFY